MGAPKINTTTVTKPKEKLPSGKGKTPAMPKPNPKLKGGC